MPVAVMKHFQGPRAVCTMKVQMDLARTKVFTERIHTIKLVGTNKMGSGNPGQAGRLRTLRLLGINALLNLSFFLSTLLRLRH